MQLSTTEENYIKTIFQLEQKKKQAITTTMLASNFQLAPASITDMMKKLKDKKLVMYEKYQGVNLTQLGALRAKSLLRRHRLWEVFLVKNLDFKWDEVHEIAEELEHISSEKLIDKLDAYLGFPKKDPHGDPIPDASGKMPNHKWISLSTYSLQKKCVVEAVTDQSKEFLQALTDMDISTGSIYTLIQRNKYDGSLQVMRKDKSVFFMSLKMAENIWVEDFKTKLDHD